MLLISCCIVIVLLFYVKTYSCAVTSSSCSKDHDKCIQELMQAELPKFSKGLPQLGVDTIDPLIVENLNLSFNGGLQIHISDGLAKGFRKCNVEKVSLSGNTFETQFLCNITIKGKYKAVGRLLLFPINGDGDAVIHCKNLRLFNVLKLKSYVQESGQKHAEIISSSTKHKYDGQITFNLTNLLRGSPSTSNAVLEFINQNWRLIAQEFGDPFVKYGAEAIIGTVKQLLKMIPLEQLFPVPVSF